jgi:hypothetical protein
MESRSDHDIVMPPSVMEAIRNLIEQANSLDLPIIEVTESAAKLAATMPEAAALGVERLRDEIAFVASRDSRVGLSINRAA